MAIFPSTSYVQDFGVLREDVLKQTLRDALYLRHMTPLVVFLPATYDDATKPAMENILATYARLQHDSSGAIDRIIVGLDQADEQQFCEIADKVRTVPRGLVIWNDSPEILQIYREVGARQMITDGSPENIIAPGKGRNFWTALGYSTHTRPTASFVTHDSDILPQYFNERFVLSLATPVINNQFQDVMFVKGYYRRIRDAGNGCLTLGGRVCRLFMFPLLEAMADVYGDEPMVRDFLGKYLSAFHYPLSGEFAMRWPIAKTLPISHDWALEINLLGHLFGASHHKAQVDLGDFDHKHQEDLRPMTREIAKYLFRKSLSLSSRPVDEEPLLRNEDALRDLLLTYESRARSIVLTYRNYALSQGLSYDETQEGDMIRIFLDELRSAHMIFREKQDELSPITRWDELPGRLKSGLLKAVREYNLRVGLDSAFTNDR